MSAGMVLNNSEYQEANENVHTPFEEGEKYVSFGRSAGYP